MQTFLDEHMGRALADARRARWFAMGADPRARWSRDVRRDDATTEGEAPSCLGGVNVRGPYLRRVRSMGDLLPRLYFMDVLSGDFREASVEPLDEHAETSRRRHHADSINRVDRYAVWRWRGSSRYRHFSRGGRRYPLRPASR